MNGEDRLDLQATIPAEELARLRRRVAYLEAVLVQVMREDRQVREWFTAAALAELALPGLPMTASGITRLARREGWESQITMERGQERVAYHVTALPRRAFTELLDSALHGAPPPAEAPDPRPARHRSSLRHADLIPANTTPQWVLPLMRLMKVQALPLGDAVRALPSHMVGGDCPTVGEAHRVLSRLGVLAG